jgi:hypothetical protein
MMKMDRRVLIIVALIGASVLTLPFPTFLQGVSQKVDFPSFSAGGFLDKTFQMGCDSWFSQSFGLRGLYISINNQLYYSLFRKSYLKEKIIIGKKRYLYEETYIRCYLYTEIDRAKMEAFAIDYKEVQDRLSRRGICSAICITPNKAVVYPEFIPDRYFANIGKDAAPRQACDVLMKIFDAHGIHYINCAGHVKEMKRESPVFSRGGTHWNDLGKYHGTDFFIKRLESLAEKDFRNPKIIECLWDNHPVGEDDDLATYLNNLICPRYFPVPHVKLGYDSTECTSRPDMLIVGTSFTNGLIDTLSKIRFYTTLHYFYYLRAEHVYYKNGEEIRRVQKPQGVPEEFLRDMLTRDIVILEFNENFANSVNCDFTRAFVDAARKIL